MVVRQNLASYDDSIQPTGTIHWKNDGPFGTPAPHVEMKKLHHDLVLTVEGPDEDRIRDCIRKAAATIAATRPAAAALRMQSRILSSSGPSTVSTRSWCSFFISTCGAGVPNGPSFFQWIVPVGWMLSSYDARFWRTTTRPRASAAVGAGGGAYASSGGNWAAASMALTAAWTRTPVHHAGALPR